jgi:hypothetical protein
VDDDPSHRPRSVQLPPAHQVATEVQPHLVDPTRTLPNRPPHGRRVTLRAVSRSRPTEPRLSSARTTSPDTGETLRWVPVLECFAIPGRRSQIQRAEQGMSEQPAGRLASS